MYLPKDPAQRMVTDSIERCSRRMVMAVAIDSIDGYSCRMVQVVADSIRQLAVHYSRYTILVSTYLRDACSVTHVSDACSVTCDHA